MLINYEIPEMQIVKLRTEDVIRTSGLDEVTSDTPEGSDKWSDVF